MTTRPVRDGFFLGRGRRALVAGAVVAVLGTLVVLVVREVSRPWGADADDSTTGAAAIFAPATKSVNWSELTHVDRMRPLPDDAVNDRAPFYRKHPECQTDVGVSKPSPCVFGDSAASRTMVIVGDSKIVQWQTALSDLGKAEGWKVVQITKSACPFTAARVIREGEVWEDCHEWGRAALREILKIEPNVVVTSHGRATALPDGATASTRSTPEAMARGMATYWQALTDSGIRVVAMLDNPTPTNSPVYECVARHPDTLDQCSFDKSVGARNSGAPTAQAAADLVDGVTTIDMKDVICPDKDRCAPVIGNVLVYRQGSHITRTYIDSMKPQLAKRLYRATSGDFGER